MEIPNILTLLSNTQSIVPVLFFHKSVPFEKNWFISQYMWFINSCAENKRSHLTSGQTGSKTLASCNLRFQKKEELQLWEC